MVSVKRVNNILRRMASGTTTVDDAEAMAMLLRAMATRLAELAVDNHERATWTLWAKSVSNDGAVRGTDS